MRPGAATAIKANIDKKRAEIEELIAQMKDMFGGVARELRAEAAKQRNEMAEIRGDLQEVMGFEDQVKGFDIDMVTDDNIDFLDIYAEFLGEEYIKMKENFQKAIATMTELFMLENERAKMSAPIQYEELIHQYEP